jgi:DNA-directed RNA polymerase specialized sigma24 family protein
MSALTALAEPHRTVLLMRYFDGLPPGISPCDLGCPPPL